MLFVYCHFLQQAIFPSNEMIALAAAYISFETEMTDVFCAFGTGGCILNTRCPREGQQQEQTAAPDSDDRGRCLSFTSFVLHILLLKHRLLDVSKN